MPVVHIRVIELKCGETRNMINYFFVNFYTNSKPTEVQKLSIDIAQKNSKVLSSCSKSICLDVDNYSQNQLYVQLKRHRMIISDDDVGKVVIPLKWFPRRKIVREWFPLTSAGKLKKTLMDSVRDMQSSSQNKNTTNRDTVQPEYNDGSENLMVLLDIHIAKKKDKPFDAPFSSMRVLPSWKKPLLLQGSEFPPVPPIAYIVGRNPDVTQDDTIPLHQSYVIMLPPGQSNPNNNATSGTPNVSITNSNNNNINMNNSNIANHPNNPPQLQTPPILNPQQQTPPTLNPQQQEPESQSELQPYFPAPQPNTCPPANNYILPPFMQGSEEGLNVTLVTEMSPYSHPNSMNQIFATDDVPNVYYPQVNIINEEEDDDDDDDDEVEDIKDEDDEDNDSQNNNEDEDDLKDDNE